MPWVAKPSGSFGYSSEEGINNLTEMYSFFEERGYTIEAQAGVMANCAAESGLNPWRWQGDVVNYSGGYGLFQFTPASGYIPGMSGVENYSPNLSVTEITPGATAEDAIAQLIVLDEDRLSKWGGGCWRPYWDVNVYPDLYRLRGEILRLYGNGSYLSYEQFKLITDVYDATFAFLACYEGPLVPNMDARYNYAVDIYELLTGEIPNRRKRKGMPIYFYLRLF